MEQLFSMPSLGRLLKSLLPGLAIAYLSAAILLRDWHSILNLSQRSALGLGAYGARRLLEVAWKSVLVLLAWSGADYLIERHKLNSELRMSRQDLMDEYKETEGHPTIKARIRRLRRQVQRQRMLADVKRASVVITNPNEFAVALEYGPQLPAPTVIAKGRNLLAQQIKQEARWHGIALVENPPLAHALYRSVEIGQSIPPKLYAVVAAVLAAIYRAQERANRKHGA
jgi:flagellar biosynthetic protein FlhB